MSRRFSLANIGKSILSPTLLTRTLMTTSDDTKEVLNSTGHLTPLDSRSSTNPSTPTPKSPRLLDGSSLAVDINTLHTQEADIHWQHLLQKLQKQQISSSSEPLLSIQITGPDNEPLFDNDENSDIKEDNENNNDEDEVQESTFTYHAIGE
ncbi:MAG: hypothetical protein Sylvanvirus25_3 [Sylvanvirus sp.]|uniref:Uncharacterized protein n=1 Tax=Sylvanvirus sp. TaxID=2487774 RepID=A0A3G5AK71_9VIRU|nr:MAG: hypothetical protein Sylvanvirus25_3 [Sylvanvirus sp.]